MALPRNGLYRLYTNSWWYFNRKVGDKLINRQICWVCNFQTPPKYIICISIYLCLYIYILFTVLFSNTRNASCRRLMPPWATDRRLEAPRKGLTLLTWPGWKVASHRRGHRYREWFLAGFQSRLGPCHCAEKIRNSTANLMQTSCNALFPCCPPQIPTFRAIEKTSGWWFSYRDWHYHLVMTNIAMENHHF